MILPKYMPWFSTLLEIDINEEVQFVIFPSKEDGFTIQCVNLNHDTFDLRKMLPEQWAGKRKGELGDVIGIDDAIFCHPGRFIAGAKSEESIMKMLEIALNN